MIPSVRNARSCLLMHPVLMVMWHAGVVICTWWSSFIVGRLSLTIHDAALKDMDTTFYGPLLLTFAKLFLLERLVTGLYRCVLHGSVQTDYLASFIIPIMKITYPFPNFNGCTVEVWRWISNFITPLIMGVITPPCWIKVSWSVLVKPQLATISFLVLFVVLEKKCLERLRNCTP